jgi:hypothetical protein
MRVINLKNSAANIDVQSITGVAGAMGDFDGFIEKL